MTHAPAAHRRRSTALTWRLLRDPPRAGSRNMALDHALAEELGEGEAALRLYAWERPTVSFGRNEPTRDVYSREAGEEAGVEYVRRPTGGRAVLHDAELTYAVVAPLRAMDGVRNAYRRINHALAAALRALGAPVALAEETVVPSVDAGPCFQDPTGGEVTARGRKLVGSAQCRIGGAILQHGSILLDGDQSLLTRLSCAPPSTEKKGGEERAPPATLTELVAGVDRDDVADAVVRAMRASFDGAWTEDAGYRPAELAAADLLERERYGSDEWTWRR